MGYFCCRKVKSTRANFLRYRPKTQFCILFFINDYLIYNKQDWNKSMTAKRSLQLKTHNLQKIFDQTSHCAKFLEAASVWSFLTRYDQFRSCWPVEKKGNNLAKYEKRAKKKFPHFEWMNAMKTSARLLQTKVRSIFILYLNKPESFFGLLVRCRE